MHRNPAEVAMLLLRSSLALALFVAASNQALANPPGHHGGDYQRPYRDCAACHGPTLEGADYGMLQTPSCFQCHDDEWADEDNLPPIVDTGGPYSISAGETLVVDASDTNDPNGDSLTYVWDFGDGWPPLRPKSRGTATHTYENPGTFSGTLTVGDGYNPPVVVAFTVEVIELPVYDGDVWSIATTESPPEDFLITIEDYDGSLVVLKDNGVDPPQVAVGIEFSGIIFWMDVRIDPFGVATWFSGSTYFANINRRSGVMTGVVSSGAGGIALFSGRKL
jgi:hypothetical protein